MIAKRHPLFQREQRGVYPCATPDTAAHHHDHVSAMPIAKTTRAWGDSAVRYAITGPHEQMR